MKKQTRLRAALRAILVLACSGLSEVNSNCISQDQDQRKDCPFLYCSPFRYVIVYNKVIGGSVRSRNALRFVDVLLDEKAFSEETLIELFKLISKRFPRPIDLDVTVYTNLEQISTPEERDAGGISEGPGNPAADQYPVAILVRERGGNEWLRYYTYKTNPPGFEMKTVVLKGRAP